MEYLPNNMQLKVDVLYTLYYIFFTYTYIHRISPMFGWWFWWFSDVLGLYCTCISLGLHCMPKNHYWNRWLVSWRLEVLIVWLDAQTPLLQPPISNQRLFPQDVHVAKQHVCVHVCICIYTVNIYVYVCIYIYICIFMYTYIYQFLHIIPFAWNLCVLIEAQCEIKLHLLALTSAIQGEALGCYISLGILVWICWRADSPMLWWMRYWIDIISTVSYQLLDVLRICLNYTTGVSGPTIFTFNTLKILISVVISNASCLLRNLRTGVETFDPPLVCLEGPTLLL